MIKFSLLFLSLISLSSCLDLKNKRAISSKESASKRPEWSAAISSKAGVLPMVQVATSAHIAQFNILVPSGIKYDYKIEDENGVALDQSHLEVKEATFEKSLYKISKLKVSHLNPNIKYSLKVSERGTLFDVRYFKTIDTSKKDLSFAFGSCSADDDKFKASGDLIWSQLESRLDDLDFILFNGDLVYADSMIVFGYKKLPKKNQIWKRYVDSFRNLKVHYFKNLKPIFSTWDDHDIGMNDGDITWRESRDGWIPYDEAFKAFNAFYGSEEISGIYKKGAGVSSTLTLSGQKFFFLDNRSFRQPDKIEVSGKKYDHLGEEQTKSFIKELSQTSEPSFIISGGQFFGGYLKKESFEYDHKDDFQHFLKELSSKAKSPFVFLSGDVHFSEIQKVKVGGFTTYEFTSSPWQSRVKFVNSDPKLTKLTNPNRLSSYEGFNFMIAKTRAQEDQSLEVEVKVINIDGEVPGSKSRFNVKL